MSTQQELLSADDRSAIELIRQTWLHREYNLSMQDFAEAIARHFRAKGYAAGIEACAADVYKCCDSGTKIVIGYLSDNKWDKSGALLGRIRDRALKDRHE